MIKRTRVRLHILPGGMMPERKTEDAAGYDVHARAIVSPRKKDPKTKLRKTLFDFREIPLDPELAKRIERIPLLRGRGTELAYRLDPGESVLVGIGFITEMPKNIHYEILQRSSLPSLRGIILLNGKSIVDADFRGEAAALLYNSAKEPFFLRHGARIAQIKFCWSLFPKLVPKFSLVDSPRKLSKTARGTKGFGSTGI